MTWWDDLAGEYEEQRTGTTREFITLMLELWHELQQQGDVTRVAEALERKARLGVFYTFDLAGRAQLRELAGGLKDGDLLTAAAETLALRQGALARERALDVLGRATLAQVSPYARLAAGVLVTDALRTGLQGGATLGGATHKRFTRIRAVKEPRSHSVLEGVVKRMDEPFVITGIPVHGPGDARLPWSEKAWCGHALEYLRLGQMQAAVPDTERRLTGMSEQERIKPGIHVGEVKGFHAARRGKVLRGADLAGLDRYLEANPLKSVTFHAELADDVGTFNGDHVGGHIRISGLRRSGKDFGVPFRWGRIEAVSVAAESKELAMQRTFVHELGHNVIDFLRTRLGRSELELILSQHYAEAFTTGRCVSERAAVNWREYFCETLSADTYYPQELMRRDPAGSKMVQKIRALLEELV